MNRHINTALLGLLVMALCADAAVAQQASPAKPQVQATAQASQDIRDPGKFDTSLPVEITSDSLEVLQHENKAIFKGNVVAVQGQVRLKADMMVVHYKQKSGTQQSPASAKPATPESPQEQMGAITQIEVIGNVLVASPQESAKGDKGDYDVAARTLHLFGSNVVLTRDKNIMRGTALEYNMETGRSILTNSSDMKNAGTARVRSVFVPNQNPTPPSKDK